jgi:hypothetical protein
LLDSNICVFAFAVFSLCFFFCSRGNCCQTIGQSSDNAVCFFFCLPAFLLFLWLNCLSVVCFLASVPHLPIFLVVEGEGCFFGNVWWPVILGVTSVVSLTMWRKQTSLVFNCCPAWTHGWHGVWLIFRVFYLDV